MWTLQMILVFAASLLSRPSAAVLPDAPVESAKGPIVLQVHADDDTDAPGNVIFLRADGAPADANAAGMRFFVASPDEADDDDDASADDNSPGASKVKTFKKRIGDIQPGGPWLGVQFGPVSKPMAAQLGLDKGAGQMVINVAEGSPADQAQLQQYDVITAVDGRPVASEMGSFLEVVRAFKPGESHQFSLLRKTQQAQANVIVGMRPDNPDGIKYKFENDQEDLFGGQAFGRSGMLKKDDKGNWTFKGFDLKDMPDVWKTLPGVDDQDFQLNAPGNDPGSQHYISKQKGEVLHVLRKADGQIVVARTKTEDGKKATNKKTYANEDELKKDDADAAKLIANGPGYSFKFSGDGKFQAGPLPPDFHEHIHSAMKAYHEAMKQAGDATNNAMSHADVFMSGKARTSFETLSDGRIQVTTRRGEDELVKTYDNAEALKAARPGLYKKYERLQKASAPKKEQD